jgi:hypothetical protein
MIIHYFFKANPTFTKSIQSGLTSLQKFLGLYLTFLLFYNYIVFYKLSFLQLTFNYIVDTSRDIMPIKLLGLSISSQEGLLSVYAIFIGANNLSMVIS